MPTPIDLRLVLQYVDGQMSFRHIRQNATYEQLFQLADALNRFQVTPAQKTLLVTTTQF